MKHINILLLAATLFMALSCGDSEEERKMITRQERERLRKEDSLALKIGVSPTLDCLPLYVAKKEGLFDSLGVDVRLKPYPGRIDSDEAVIKGLIEGCVTDRVRAGHIRERGTGLRYVASTGAYWQLISNRKARIRELKQMTDKMIAMARYSVTEKMADMAVDSAKLVPEYVFRIQVNNPNTRLKMLLNNEMDAVVLTEPQATTARLYKNPVLMDSRDKGLDMGVLVFSEKALTDSRRQQQLEKFVKAYDAAVGEINRRGVKAYAALITEYTKADNRTVNALPKMKFDNCLAGNIRQNEKEADTKHTGDKKQ